MPFNEKTQFGKQLLNSIRRVCLAYAVRNPVIGYVQGFSMIVGRLLQVMNEEEAFYLFCQLIEGVLPFEYY